MKYDVFLSYRREGGYDTAKHLNDLLVRDGYRVSFDIDTLRNGDFDTQLLERIEKCKDFILIVDQHTFDRTLDPKSNPNEDWVRRELAHALKYNKNIIPVFLAGVSSFPKGLPEDIANVIYQNGPKYNKYFFNTFYRELCRRFLKSWSRKTIFKICGGIVFLIIGIVLSIILLFANRGIVYVDPLTPHSTDTVQFHKYARQTIDEQAAMLSISDSVDIFKYWQQEAANGDSQAQLNLGLCHFVGYGCEINPKKVAKHISKAAKQGLATAQYSLGVCYDNGIGVRSNLNKAFDLYKQAAEQDVIEAQSDYGVAFGWRNDLKNAFLWIGKAAEAGYAPAQYNLAMMFGSGANTIKDAIYWCEEAADQDYEPAYLALSNMYLWSPYEEYRDVSSAIEILELLSEEGNALAQYNLACCYLSNVGVDKDRDIALDLLQKSAEQGFAMALADLGLAYATGSFENLPQNSEKAMEYLLKASGQGYAWAQYYIANMYNNGLGVKKNKLKAWWWYRKAAKQNVTPQLEQQLTQQRNQWIYNAQN